jgi:hypothetical protein
MGGLWAEQIKIASHQKEKYQYIEKILEKVFILAFCPFLCEQKRSWLYFRTMHLIVKLAFVNASPGMFHTSKAVKTKCLIHNPFKWITEIIISY